MSQHCQCGASTENYLCTECYRHLAGWVDELLGVHPHLGMGRSSMQLLVELSVTATRQDRLDGTGPALYSTKHVVVPPAPPTTLPPFLRSPAGASALTATRWQLAWDAAQLLADARSTMAVLAREIAAAVGIAPVLPLSAFFAAHLHRVTTMDTAGQWFDDIRWLREAVERAVDRREGELFAGRCTEPWIKLVDVGPFTGPTCGPWEIDCEHESCVAIREREYVTLAWQWVCGTDLYYRAEQAEVRCQCGMVYDVIELKAALLAGVDDAIDTTTVIANALTGIIEPVTPAMIRKMAHQGQIVSRGLARDGKSMTYRVGDVVAVLAARRDKREQAHRSRAVS